jgi:hypothetical protein
MCGMEMPSFLNLAPFGTDTLVTRKMAEKESEISIQILCSRKKKNNTSY